MKFGTAFLLLLLGALCLFSSACTSRSPAVEVFEEFKGNVVSGNYAGAYQMLSETGRPSQADFEAGMKGPWAKWFTGEGSLRTVRRVDSQPNMLTGDLFVDGDTQVGAFEVVRADEKSPWKVLWKLGSGDAQGQPASGFDPITAGTK